jgi:hypothetical protein
MFSQQKTPLGNYVGELFSTTKIAGPKEVPLMFNKKVFGSRSKSQSHRHRLTHHLPSSYKMNSSQLPADVK